MSSAEKAVCSDRNAVLEATWLALRSGAKMSMLPALAHKPWTRTYLG